MGRCPLHVTVALTRLDLVSVSGQQLRILNRIGVTAAMEPTAADLVVDAVIGYSLLGDPAVRTQTSSCLSLSELAHREPLRQSGRLG